MAAAISTHPNRKIRIAIPLLSASSLACPPRSRLQQLLQLLAPEFCHAGGSMAAGVFAGRYQVKPAVLHALEFAFRDSGFRRIAFIVSRIDRQERGLNPFEAGRWVVVARRLPLVKKVKSHWHRWGPAPLSARRGACRPARAWVPSSGTRACLRW